MSVLFASLQGIKINFYYKELNLSTEQYERDESESVNDMSIIHYSDLSNSTCS